MTPVYTRNPFYLSSKEGPECRRRSRDLESTRNHPEPGSDVRTVPVTSPGTYNRWIVGKDRVKRERW